MYKKFSNIDISSETVIHTPALGNKFVLSKIWLAYTKNAGPVTIRDGVGGSEVFQVPVFNMGRSEYFDLSDDPIVSVAANNQLTFDGPQDCIVDGILSIQDVVTSVYPRIFDLKRATLLAVGAGEVTLVSGVVGKRITVYEFEVSSVAAAGSIEFRNGNGGSPLTPKHSAALSSAIKPPDYLFRTDIGANLRVNVSVGGDISVSYWEE